jgi:hypothetical protein
MRSMGGDDVMIKMVSYLDWVSYVRLAGGQLQRFSPRAPARGAGFLEATMGARRFLLFFLAHCCCWWVGGGAGNVP